MKIPENFKYEDINAYDIFKKEDGFLPLVVNMLSKIDPVSIDSLYNFSETIKNADVNLKEIIFNLYARNRSDFIAKSMLKNPMYGSLTPLFLWAMKRDNGINYMDWDLEDENIKYALGKFLEPILSFRKKHTRDEFDTKELRDNILDPSQYRLKGCKLTRPMNYILTQSWIAQPSVRIEETMILDPWDWDFVPEPLEIVEINIEKPLIRAKGDLPF